MVWVKPGWHYLNLSSAQNTMQVFPCVVIFKKWLVNWTSSAPKRLTVGYMVTSLLYRTCAECLYGGADYLHGDAKYLPCFCMNLIKKPTECPVRSQASIREALIVEHHNWVLPALSLSFHWYCSYNTSYTAFSSLFLCSQLASHHVWWDSGYNRTAKRLIRNDQGSYKN